MATSAPNEFLISRIRNYSHLLKATKEEVEQTKIRGSGESRFKKLASKLIADLLKGLQRNIALMKRVDIDPDGKSALSEGIHQSLEAFLNWVDLILRHCNAVDIEMHQFVSQILEDLDFKDMDYLLLSGWELSETSLSESLKKLFSGIFPLASDTLANEFPSFCILFIPQSLLKNPINWPLCVHEIGHMIENEKLKIVESFYSRPEFGPVSTRITYSIEALKYRYSKEFQADYFATTFFGPVFPNQLVDNYFTKEVFIHPTHPSWEERIRALVEVLRTMGLQGAAENLKNKSSSISTGPSMIPKDSLEFLNQILMQTRGLLEREDAIYKTNENNINRSREALTKFIPYTDDMKSLLNVAGEVKKNLLENAKSTKKKEKVEKFFDPLIKDSIRLSYLKRTYAKLDRR